MQNEIDMIFIYSNNNEYLREAIRTYKDKFSNHNCSLRYI